MGFTRRNLLTSALVLFGCRPPVRSTRAFTPAPLSRWDAHVHIPAEAGSGAYRNLARWGIEGGLNLSGGPSLRRFQLQRSLQPQGWHLAITLPWSHAASEEFVFAAERHLTRARDAGASALKIEKGLGLHYRGPKGLLEIDDPWLDPIFERAGALQLPVFIHSADPESFWKPVGPNHPRFEELSVHPGWAYAGRPVPGFEALWTAFVRRVERHPDTRFVGVHFGNRAEDPERVGRLMRRLPNLWVDLAARIPELGHHDPEALRRLFLEHQDRILFGTDFAVVGPDAYMLGTLGEDPATPDQVPEYFQACFRWLETDQRFPSMTPLQGRHRIVGLNLPVPVLEKIYRKNAEALLTGA